MRAFDDIYVHPSFAPEAKAPSSATSQSKSSEQKGNGDLWQYAMVGTALTIAVSGVGMAVGVPNIVSA